MVARDGGKHHRRRQRARAARAARRRQVLLGPGPQADAGGAAAGAQGHRVPRQARHAGRAGDAHRGAGRARSRATCPAPTPPRPNRRRSSARPTSSPAWSASSPSCRASWAATTRWRRSCRRRRRRHRRSLRAGRAERPLPTRRSRSRWRWPTSSTRWSRFWSIGEKPTGSRDPFALRRAALGVIRIIVENGIRLPLRQFFAGRRPDGLLRRPAEGADAREGRAPRPDRRGLRAWAARTIWCACWRASRRVQSFLGSEDGTNLLTAYKRAANIVRSRRRRTRRLRRRIAGRPMPRCWNKPRRAAAATAHWPSRALGRALAARGFRRRHGEPSRLARAGRWFLRQGHGECRRRARFAPEPAEIAHPDPRHDGPGGGLLEDRGLKMTKWVYTFGDGKAEGGADMRNLLGGKGANLAEMSSLGLPVPPGFTITTEVCTYYYANNNSYPPELKDEVEQGARPRSRGSSAPKFGDADNPLLVSVRSGARASMPGMMDTVLNLGLNDRTVEGLAQVVGRRALRLGQLPPLHPDVLQRRARRRPPLFRGDRSSSGRRTTASTSTPSSRPTTGARGRPSTRRSSRSAPASRSRRSRASSSGAPSARCSARG